MEVLLIEPPRVSKFGNQRVMGAFGSNKADLIWPPLESMMISGYLRKKGFSSTIYDANAANKTLLDIKEEIIKQKPFVVAFQTSLTTIHKDLLVADAAKECSKKILTVAFGIPSRVLAEKILKQHNNLDIAACGESEQIIYNIVKNKNNLKKALGIAYKKNNKIIKNPLQPNCKNLDELGLPAHDKIDKELYHDPIVKAYPMTMVMGQRGCVNNCTFCHQPAFWAPFRKRSVKHIIKELKQIKKLGFKEIIFNDSGLTHDLKWANELLDEMIKNKFGFKWTCCVRIDNVNQDILKKMHKAGCHAIYVGMESADPTVLKNIKKNVAPEKIKSTASLIKKAGIDVLVFFMLGLPGETKESMKRTIKFAKTLNVNYITMGIAVPVPGTKFYNYVEKNNYLITKDFSKYDPMEKPVFNYPNLSGDEIYAAMKKGIKSFYLRPSYTIKTLLSIRSFGDFKRFIINGKSFIKRFIFTN